MNLILELPCLASCLLFVHFGGISESVLAISLNKCLRKLFTDQKECISLLLELLFYLLEYIILKLHEVVGDHIVKIGLILRLYDLVDSFLIIHFLLLLD